MPEEILYSWRVKIVAAVVLFLAFVGLDLWSSRYGCSDPGWEPDPRWW
ncbi:MAG: hypothetical protein KatS3mg115_2400 [Candidatus Poribacteria bacterium]|nr:MAG: hypothetical protein KatS3mg115_2400 [Candidatus Poribacteria bacterium]